MFWNNAANLLTKITDFIKLLSKCVHFDRVELILVILKVTYRVWGVILLAKSITPLYHLNTRSGLNKCWIYRCPWPWRWINWDESNDKIRMILSNFHSCGGVLSLGKVSGWAHFSKQQQGPTMWQTLNTISEYSRISNDSEELSCIKWKVRWTINSNLQFQSIHNSRARNYVSIDYISPI